MEASIHVTVLKQEVVEMLEAASGGRYLDCTFGGGGHTEAILLASADSQVVAIDRDSRAVSAGRPLMAQYPDRCTLTHLSFSAIERAFCGTSFKGILADLGLSTDQIKGGRGFSFNDQELPDMRMDQTRGESVAALLERISPQELYVILKEGGVGSEARSVARAIIQGRPFTSSRDLANVIAAAVPISQQKRGVHPATVSFQALRMAVNEERQEIEQLLLSAERLATVGTRLAIITFHSIEDTLVTRTMRRWENQGSVPANYRGVCVEKSKGKVLTRKPIVPTEDEVRRNPASRSARLRVFEFM